MSARRKIEWRFPTLEGTGTFVFMSVDVIKHTEMLAAARKHSLSEFERVDQMLGALRTFIRNHISYDERLEWSWAGDGGIYAFPWSRAYDFNLYEYVVRRAEKIVSDLRAFNARYHVQHPVKLRVAINTGEALYRSEAAFRRSVALNFVTKLKVPDDEDSIAITDSAYSEVRQVTALRTIFVTLPPDDADVHATPIYVHAELAKASLALKAAVHVAADQPIFASHCEYRQFTVDFGRGHFDAAAKSIGRAIELVRSEILERYFTATLLAFFKSWQTIAVAMSDKTLTPTTDPSDRLLFLHDRQVADYLPQALGAPAAQLVVALEYIQEQFSIIARRHIGGPRSLAVLEMATILLRTGFSPLLHNQALLHRTQQFVAELQSHEWTLDDKCSLCTGKALSVLGLAGITENAEKIVKWFSSLEDDRFSILEGTYTGAKRDHHAMHYAASVGQALADAGFEELLARVIAKFFPTHLSDAGQLLDYWLKWRGENTFWVGSYIFAFLLWLQHHARFRSLLEPHHQMIAQACVLYVSLLKKDAELAKLENDAHLYATRENLCVFALSHRRGEEAHATLISDVLEIFNRKIRRTVDRYWQESAQHKGEPRRIQPFDSSVDRTVRFIENWLRHFESVFSVDGHVQNRTV